MLFTHNDIVYTYLSGKRKFTCLICNEVKSTKCAFIGHRLGQYVGYACEECCHSPQPVINESVHKEIAILELVDIETLNECVRILAKYSRRSSLAKEILLRLDEVRSNLVDKKICSDIEIDNIILDEIERCIVDGLVKRKKKNAFSRNVLGLLKTLTAKDKFIVIMEF